MPTYAVPSRAFSYSPGFRLPVINMQFMNHKAKAIESQADEVSILNQSLCALLTDSNMLFFYFYLLNTISDCYFLLFC